MRPGGPDTSVASRALAGLRRAPLPSLALATALIVGVVGPLIWWRIYAAPDVRLVDLAVYRSAGESLLVGRPLYDYLTPLPQLLPFTYPPFSAILAIPLALLSSDVSNWLWTVGTVAVLAWLVLVSFRPAIRRTPQAWHPVAGAFFLCAMAWILPVRDNLRFGQVGIFLAALCVIDCAAARPKFPRGVLIGLATAIKLTPGVFIPYLWITGRRKAAVTALLTFVAASGLTFLVLPNASWNFWSLYITDSSRLGDNAGTSNQALRGMFVRAMPDHIATLVWVVAAIAVAVFAYWRARAVSATGQELRAVVIIGLMSVLVSPVSWIHHLAGYIPLAIGITLVDGRKPARLLAAVALTVFYSIAIPWWWHSFYVDGAPMWVAQIAEDSFGIAALIVLVLLGRTEPPPIARPAAVQPLEAVKG